MSDDGDEPFDPGTILLVSPWCVIAPDPFPETPEGFFGGLARVTNRGRQLVALFTDYDLAERHMKADPALATGYRVIGSEIRGPAFRLLAALYQLGERFVVFDPKTPDDDAYRIDRLLAHIVLQYPPLWPQPGAGEETP